MAYFHRDQLGLDSYGNCERCGESAILNNDDLCELCERELSHSGYL